MRIGTIGKGPSRPASSMRMGSSFKDKNIKYMIIRFNSEINFEKNYLSSRLVILLVLIWCCPPYKLTRKIIVILILAYQLIQKHNL